MPITSAQISGLVGGQQAMFGNNAAYSRAISPFGGQQMPSFSNPMAGAQFPMSTMPGAEFNQGAGATPGMISGMANVGAPMLAGAGMMMGGAVGGALDPFTGGMRGLARGSGWRAGAGITANIGNVARGGIGGIARGVGMGAMGMLPGMAIGGAIKYAGGQMMQGAQFQNQVGGFLQNQFRFANEQSRTGYGFSQAGQQQIGRMAQEMGTQDALSTPQEMLNIMRKGAQMGQFRGVRDAKEFRQKFKQMTDSLKQISSIFNKTLEDSIPLLKGAQQQGFWSPQDIMRHAQTVSQVQANTGMSAAQAQQTMAVGAQMVRGIGGTGQQGARMMAAAQGITGAALSAGSITSQQLQESGFGMGAQGAQNFGTMLAGASARFARGRTGRWMMAAMMNKGGTGLDPAKLQQMMAGGMSIGQIGRMARSNVRGAGAYNFRQNEEQMRGQLAEAGPQATLGFVRGLAGGRLYGGGAKDRLITNRLIRRFMGGNKRQAEHMAQLARDMPRIMAVQAAQTEASADARERQQGEVMQNTLQGMKRRIGNWWKKNVDAPMQKVGADMASSVGRAWQKFTDRLAGTTGRGSALSAGAVRAMAAAAETGDRGAMATQFATRGETQQILGTALTGPGTVSDPSQMAARGFMPTGTARQSGIAGMLGARQMAFNRADIPKMQAMQRAEAGLTGRAEAEALGFGSMEGMEAERKGEGARQIQAFMRSGTALRLAGKAGTDKDVMATRRLASQYVRQLRTGRFGEEAKRLVSGVSMQQAISRVMSMQGGAKELTTGLATGGGGVISGTLAEVRTKLEETRESAVEDLTTALTGGGGGSAFVSASGKLRQDIEGIKGVPVTDEGINELLGNEDAVRAMKLMAQADQESGLSEDQRTAMRDEARKLMVRVGNDKDNVSEKGRSAAIRMTDSSDPQSKQIAKAMGRLGSVERTKDNVEVAAKTMGRMQRLRNKLGTKGQAALSIAAGKNKALGQALSDVLNPNAAQIRADPNVRAQQMRRLAILAAQDPEAAQKIAATMAQEGAGATGVGALISSVVRAGALIKKGAVSPEDEARQQRIGGTRKARFGVAALMAEMNLGDVAKKEKGLVKDLIMGKSTKATEELREVLKKRKRWSDDQIEDFMKDLTGGLTKGEMTERAAGAAAGLGSKALNVRVAKEAGLDPSRLNITRRDSPELIEAKKQSGFLQAIAEKIEAISKPGDTKPDATKNKDKK